MPPWNGWPRARRAKAQARPPAGPVRYLNAPVQLGSQRFCVTAAVHPAPLFAGEAGLLGNGLLSKFCLTIDEPRGRVRLEKAP